MDHVLSPYDWRASGTPYRDASFLDSPRLPREIAHGVVDLELASDRKAYDAMPSEQRARALPLGVEATEAVRLLERAATTRDAPILRLPHARGLLCGLGGSDPEPTRAFNELARQLLRVPPWCSRCNGPRGCQPLLRQWLTAEQIGASARRSEWCMHTPAPPPFQHGQCVPNHVPPA